VGPTGSINFSKNIKIENEKNFFWGHSIPGPCRPQLAHYSYCTNVCRITVCRTVDKWQGELQIQGGKNGNNERCNEGTSDNYNTK